MNKKKYRYKGISDLVGYFSLDGIGHDFTDGTLTINGLDGTINVVCGVNIFKSDVIELTKYETEFVLNRRVEHLTRDLKKLQETVNDLKEANQKKTVALMQIKELVDWDDGVPFFGKTKIIKEATDIAARAYVEPYSMF